MRLKLKTDAAPRENVNDVHQPSSGDKNDSALAVAFEFLRANILLLLLGPLVAGAVAVGTAYVVPQYYTSTVYLNLDETGARNADAWMRSYPVVDKVLSQVSVRGATQEERRKWIEENRRIVVASGGPQKTATLFKMEYSDRDAALAQKINTLLIDTWLEATRPPPDKRASLEAEIERTETQAKAITALIERLEKDATSFVSQSLQGELATPILGLIAKRDENLGALIDLKNKLKGMSRDVVFGVPDLPQEPSWPNKKLVFALTVAVTGLLLLALTILRYVRFRRF
ncbi:hypothetical protein JQ628_01550 [Bradyrhizobium lablabi]|uniref:hypothetical protein n=1 Tax=Bradyrhizobium lablabi TaxID=722472 RepID=UPI001BA86910|nr:hypothetical protein [Bradyrhizobium lablabi]MBR1120181.1 hypothetical protein [Bradyrhizobium lablabi]